MPGKRPYLIMEQAPGTFPRRTCPSGVAPDYEECAKLVCRARYTPEAYFN
ncbi:MAG: hypothetical protein ACREDV_05030 [Methylocella sp.]